MDFKYACCETFGWEADQFKDRALFKTYIPALIPLLLAVRAVRPRLLEPDLKILREFGSFQNRGQLRANAHQIRTYYRELKAFNFWRRWMKARISGRLLIELADRAWERN